VDHAERALWDWYYQKVAAEDAVRNLTGVKGVINLIEVRPTAKQGDVVKSKIEEALKAQCRARGSAHSG